MDQLQLTGIEQPLFPVVLGTMTFGDTTDVRAAGDMLDLFLQAGGNGVDTANGYAGGRGEAMVGDLLRERRDDVVLATKVGIPHPDAEGAPPLSIDGIRRCVTGSLRRLGTDHVDLLYLHQPDRATPITQTLTAIQELLHSGRIRAWGVSNFAAWQISEIRHATLGHGLPNPVISQQIYNVVATHLEDEYAEYAHTTGLPTIVYNPLAGGLLTGKHTARQSPGTGRFGPSQLGAMYRDRYFHDAMFTAAADLTAVADDAGIPNAELALRWAIGRPAVNGILIGGSRPQNIRANLTAIGKGPLPDDLAAAITAISDRIRGPMPSYNR